MYIYKNELLFLGKTCYKIIQFHAITGCNTTSYFCGVGWKDQTISKNYEKHKCNRTYFEFRTFSLS